MNSLFSLISLLTGAFTNVSNVFNEFGDIRDGFYWLVPEKRRHITLTMPIGITTDVLITCLGAVLGVVLGTRLPDSLKKALNNTLGIAAIAMGIVLILKVKNLSAVVLTLVIGSILGELVMLDDRIRKLVTGVVHKLMNGAAADEQFLAQVSAVVILFCCGGTGWYGALNEGLTGDGSILITKSILDFVTACIFGSILGKIVPMLCIPQAIIYGALFLVSGAVQSFITPDIISDFSATGGIITLCAGLSLAGIKKDMKVLNLLPSLILIFLISSAWTALMG